MNEYVAHLSDGHGNTACGEPWQGWQEPERARSMIVLPPHQQPRPHVDRIRQCRACVHAGLEALNWPEILR